MMREREQISHWEGGVTCQGQSKYMNLEKSTSNLELCCSKARE
jgi:hypothetical protein